MTWHRANFAGPSLAIGFALLALPAAAGDPIPEPRTALLVPGGKDIAGGYTVGLRIELPEGWHTYWRHPGDAGVPPLLTTDGSENLAAAEMRFPAPKRWSDGFSTSIVYHDSVVFPVTVRPQDPAEPVRLTLTLAYGYCREICVPATAAFEADLAPDGPLDPAAAEEIARFEARVPVPEAAATPDHPVLESVAIDGESVVLTVRSAGSADSVDIFSEPPEGWYLTQPELVSRDAGTALFRQSLKGRPKAAEVAGSRFSFTLVDGDKAVTAARILP